MAPIDIQAKLDELLAANADLQKYISKAHYLPDNAPVPADVTQINRTTSATSAERALRIGLVLKPPYAGSLDAVLALVGTQPTTRTPPATGATKQK